MSDLIYLAIIGTQFVFATIFFFSWQKERRETIDFLKFVSNKYSEQIKEIDYLEQENRKLRDELSKVRGDK